MQQSVKVRSFLIQGQELLVLQLFFRGTPLSVHEGLALRETSLVKLELAQICIVASVL